MFRLWAIARHTIRQCLRTKIAALFIILLGAGLGVLPFLMTGDGTLAGRIRTFLIYGTSLTAVLLGLVTILLATTIVSSDVDNKQIFSIATKPVARWQYILGRWLGVVLLDVILLAPASVAIYAVAHYLRGGQADSPTDRRTVETEVFAARERIGPDPLKIGEAVEERIAKMKEEGRFKSALESYKDVARGDKELAMFGMRTEILEDLAKEMQSVAPGRSMQWKFSGIPVRGASVFDEAEVSSVYRSVRLIELRGDSSLLGKLLYESPVRINGVEGLVAKITDESFVVQVPLEDMSLPTIVSLKAGSRVNIEVEPTIQLTFTLDPASYPPENTLRTYWEIRNPTEGLWYRHNPDVLGGVQTTLTLPGRVVDKAGNTVVTYVNLPNRDGSITSVTVLQEEMAVLCRVGGFGWNYFRGMLTVLVMLAFLAALGVLAGSLFSFPVACLVSFAMLPFQLNREMLVEAMSPRYTGTGIVGDLIRMAVFAMNKLLPDFGSALPGSRFVDGLNISWAFVGELALWTLCVQAVAVLAVACLMFRKRELARVQV